jgi:arabinose-5-phosphate isomerase
MHPLLLKQKELINSFFEKIDPKMMDLTLERLMNVKGNIVFTGIGKSGIAAELIAMMMTSIGTKAFYLSPANAIHGDLGMIGQDDLVVLLSKSGNTEELYQLALLLKTRKIQLMGWFCHSHGRLSKVCDFVVNLPLEKELCPYDLSPTTSSIVQIIFGNTLAVALMEGKNFSLESYLLNHPSGMIGNKIRLKVADVMLKNSALPICFSNQEIKEVLVELSDKRCGCLLVFTPENQLKGVFTDGDLRRAIYKDAEKVFNRPVEMYTTEKYISTHPEASIVEALKIMQNHDQPKKVNVLPVMENEKLVGLIRLHDIIALGFN